MRIMTSSIVTAVILGAAGAASANPTFTTINNTSGEVSQTQLMHTVYGGSWSVLGDGRSLTNGTITATRVADGGVGGPLDILNSTATSADDMAWSGGQVMVTAKARWAADQHNFGWIDDTVTPAAAASMQVLLSTSNLNSPLTLSVSPNFRWALKDLSTNEMQTSRPSDNAGGTDQMSTYRISGLSGSGTAWLLVWEDRTAGSDRDFNDSVIEVRSVPGPGGPVLAGLGALLMTRRRRS